jgi:hypothetical protein
MKKVLLSLVILLFCNSSFAERLLPVDFIGQPQMLLKDSNVNACGIRFMGIQSPSDSSDNSAPIWIADASFMLYRNNMGLVKALISESTVGAISKNSKKVSQKTFNTFWIKADNNPATSPVKGNAIDGEDAGSRIYITETDPLISLYLAIMSGEQIKLAYKFKDESKNMILYGKVSLNEDDFKQVKGCMGELAKLIAKDTLPENSK